MNNVTVDVTSGIDALCGIIYIRTEKSSIANEFESYAKEYGINVLETIQNDENILEKFYWYMENKFINIILVRSALEISSDKNVLEKLIRYAREHNISINSKELNWNPIQIPWDGGSGC